jgi:alanyl-tRNA synthetase
MTISGMMTDLKQTYGFPLELSLEFLNRNNDFDDKEMNFIKVAVDEKEKRHQELSRTASAGMFKGGLASGGETETKFHTATHLLLASLREILGKNVNQKGVNINSERIRFDFNWPQKLTDGQIKQIEDWVNDKISQNLDVKMEEMSFPEALQSGATSIPGFKYPEIVKVFSIGTISKEICGGPHVKSTGEIGKFKIIKEESSSSGVRRIRATIE